MACISNRDHVQAGVEPVQSDAISVIVVGGKHQFLARCHAITTDVSRYGTGQHVAGHIVVAVDQRTLVSTRGQHHTFGTYPVHALADHADRRAITQVVGEALVDGQEIVIVIAIDRGTWQQGDVAQAFQLGDDRRHPFSGGFAVEAFTAVEQAAAELFLFIGNDHSGTAATCCQGSGQTGRARTDDQHVAVLVHCIVAVRVVLGRRATEACSLADVLLVSHPERLRIHEGFVVETRRHQLAADLAQNAHDIGIHARPAVGAGRHQSGIERLLRGTHVGDLRRFGRADLQHGIGLFRTRCEDAARAGVFEAAADDIDAVGEQGRGQRVTFKALVGLAIEGKVEHLAAIDTAAVGQAMGLAHTLSP
ncbi:hypothetical protein ALQ20_05460 [Pseudomonas syringae pv. atrofaciens]|nr:hypothetical protein ALQ20_05460 [Pseudomonas syringae pv. atrofaciens]